MIANQAALAQGKGVSDRAGNFWACRASSWWPCTTAVGLCKNKGVLLWGWQFGKRAFWHWLARRWLGFPQSVCWVAGWIDMHWNDLSPFTVFFLHSWRILLLSESVFGKWLNASKIKLGGCVVLLPFRNPVDAMELYTPVKKHSPQSFSTLPFYLVKAPTRHQTLLLHLRPAGTPALKHPEHSQPGLYLLCDLSK